MSDVSSIESRLAINGGSPVRDRPMPARLAFGPDERAMIDAALDHYAELGLDPGYQGYFEKRYCDAFADLMGGGHADAVATGTAAIFVALAALELPKGSEVLVSPITDPGSLSAIILNGLVPKLTDSAPGSYNATSEQFVPRFDENTSAVLAVHSVGEPTDIDEIVAAADTRGIRVVEDCSQSHGAMIGERRIGTFGHIAAFSTMYRKASVTGPSGGVVYSRDETLHRRALAYADRGKPSWRDDFDDRNPSQFLFPALNLHSDEIGCAIGIASLARLDDTRARRLAFVKEVAQLIEAESGLCRPYGYSDALSPFVFPIFVDSRKIAVSKTEFAVALIAEGIPLNPHYQYVVADWPWLRPYLADDADTPNARDARDNSFCLYLNENYTNVEARDVVQAITKVERWACDA